MALEKIIRRRTLATTWPSFTRSLVSAYTCRSWAWWASEWILCCGWASRHEAERWLFILLSTLNVADIPASQRDFRIAVVDQQTCIPYDNRNCCCKLLWMWSPPLTTSRSVSVSVSNIIKTRDADISRHVLSATTRSRCAGWRTHELLQLHAVSVAATARH